MKDLLAVSIGVALSLGPASRVAAQSAAADPGPVVSTAWLHQHLDDPRVRVISTDDRRVFDKAHIPGARLLEHMDTVDGEHRLLPPEKLVPVLARAGAADNVHLVLYGTSPMRTGWVFMTLASIGHASDVSLLDGSLELWASEKRPVTSAVAPAVNEKLAVRPATALAVDRAWVRAHLQSPDVRLLDVRTHDEWDGGHLPGATLVLWQDLFADQRTLKFKSNDELRALFARAGVKPGQQVVTYCAIGMRASLMYWAARVAGLPARVYVGSYSDWQRDPTSPIVR